MSRARCRLLFLVGACVLIGFVSCHGATGPQPRAAKLSERRLPFAKTLEAAGFVRLQKAAFDVNGHLRWDESVVTTIGSSQCTRQGAPVVRLVLVSPTVAELRCPGGAGENRLFGFDENGRTVWDRPLLITTPRDQERWLLGASPEGLVLSDLDVWSPTSGETIARLRSAPGQEHAASYAGAALYLPRRRQVLIFDADVTLWRRRGGLYLIDLKTGERELWLPVTTSLVGSFDRVESMALSRDERFIILGMREEARGESPVRLSVHDLKNGRAVFEHRVGEGRVCSDPHVLAGPDGRFAMTYRDDTKRELVLLEFRLFP